MYAYEIINMQTKLICRSQMWKGDSLQPILPRQDNHLRIKSSKTKPNQTTKMFRGKELFNF